MPDSQRRAWMGIAALLGVAFLLVSFLFVIPAEEQQENKILKEKGAQSSQQAQRVTIGQVVREDPRTAASSISNGASSALPIEWEQPFFDIVMNTNQTMPERNQRLTQLATTTAASVPRVQEECLRHLALGLSDGDLEEFVSLSTAISIPANLRRDFLDQVLNIRSTTLTIPLCEALLQRGDLTVSSVALDFLQGKSATGAEANDGGGGSQ